MINVSRRRFLTSSANAAAGAVPVAAIANSKPGAELVDAEVFAELFKDVHQHNNSDEDHRRTTHAISAALQAEATADFLWAAVEKPGKPEKRQVGNTRRQKRSWGTRI